MNSHRSQCTAAKHSPVFGPLPSAFQRPFHRTAVAYLFSLSNTLDTLYPIPVFSFRCPCCDSAGSCHVDFGCNFIMRYDFIVGHRPCMHAIIHRKNKFAATLLRSPHLPPNVAALHSLPNANTDFFLQNNSFSDCANQFCWRSLAKRRPLCTFRMKIFNFPSIYCCTESEQFYCT